MKGGRGYDIFPRTLVPRVLLGLAFVGGLAIAVSYLVLYFVTFDFFNPLDLFGNVEVTIENRTDRQLTIYVNGQSEAVVPAGQTTTITTPKIEWRFNKAKLQAIDFNGVIVFEDDFDTGDLKQVDYHIIIEPVAGESENGYPPCTGPETASCLEKQTELQSIARDSCEGSEKRVCIVPLGKVSPALVEHLVDYYADEYGLAITVLTPSAIPRYMVDPQRNQIDASMLGEYMGALFPDDYSDPNAILIGLTSVDLYDKSRAWRYAFGVRSTPANPKGVISTFRMNPETFGEPRDDDLLFSRARKLVSKYIGLLYYGLSPSDDPKSPLYDSILSTADLDKMHEPLPVPVNP
jgi:predicted Zn-dependent protease